MFQIGIWDSFVNRGQEAYRYTRTACEKLHVDHSRSKVHDMRLITIHDPSMRLGQP